MLSSLENLKLSLLLRALLLSIHKVLFLRVVFTTLGLLLAAAVVVVVDVLQSAFRDQREILTGHSHLSAAVRRSCSSFALFDFPIGFCSLLQISLASLFIFIA